VTSSFPRKDVAMEEKRRNPKQRICYGHVIELLVASQSANLLSWLSVMAVVSSSRSGFDGTCYMWELNGRVLGPMGKWRFKRSCQRMRISDLRLPNSNTVKLEDKSLETNIGVSHVGRAPILAQWFN
jgi:hypothetical protein